MQRVLPTEAGRDLVAYGDPWRRRGLRLVQAMEIMENRMMFVKPRAIAH